MRDMRTIAIDVPGVFQSVSQSVTYAGCANTAKQIDVLFGVKTLEDPRNIVLNRQL